MSAQRDTPLRTASIEQLVEELARRLNENGGRTEPPEQWCDDCIHFKHGTGRLADRANYNPCTKRHKMQFYVPGDGGGPECFGYYVEVCGDRTPRPEPTPPAPTPPPTPDLSWESPDFRQAPPPRGQIPHVVDAGSEDCPE